MAVGFGFDIHPLVEGRKLLLGGVELAFPKGLEGHSDGDVVLHAIADALLGAAGKGDLGSRFPDSNPQHKDAESIIFLSDITRELYLIWQVENLDITVFAAEPRLESHRDTLRKRIAEILRVREACVNVKAKSMNGLGPLGAGNAIAAQAIVSLVSR